ncbi:uncharacterized protein EV420DRAFT_1765901 [Desarmillaria tabescens]|uniref:DUF6533 domain-containing protein n=1 Tax=Armillaria tabescens TaxID=1929756 RepID=A0AA39K673_ARMTA|nr:uncharacterized protein EV420DRAFT_1765901 [Desarmillaria tabescens]KAK0454091.1 hypothetical protein EV420DRAFT_1765901 [Desarmillaria tabescens]
MDNMDNEQAWEILLHGYLQIISLSFLYWDHLITIDDELRLLWSKPKTFGSYLFFTNRYLAFFGNITVAILGFTALSTTSCNKYALYRQILLVVSQIVVCALLTMRIYALYTCNIRVLMYMLGSGVILFAVSCWSLTDQKSDRWKDSGCHIGLSRVTAIRVATAWEALFIYDSMLFSLTFYTAYKNRTENIPLLYLVFRDGVIYYAAMALATLSNVLTFYLAGVALLLCCITPMLTLLIKLFLRGGLSSFASSVSVTLMSRLVLNLHQTTDTGVVSDNSDSTPEADSSDNETDLEESAV